MPCIWGLRLPVATVVGMFADSKSEAEIRRDYPDLDAADIRAAWHHTAAAVHECELPRLKAG